MENQYSTPEPENVASNKKSFAQNLEGKIEGILQKIDNGNIFKSIIVLFFRLIGWGILAAGLWACIINIFPVEYRDGYFSVFEDLSGMQKFTSVIGFLIGLVLCLTIVYVIFLFIKKRTSQLADAQYEGLLHYIYKSTATSLIMVCGEALSLLVLLVGILTLVATLLGSLVYFPLADMFSALGEIGDVNDIRDGSGIWIQGFNEYSTYFESLKTNGVGALGIMAVSGLVLIATYVIKEVYLYVVQLVIKLIEFALTKTGILVLFIGLVLSYFVLRYGLFSSIFGLY